MTRLPGHPVNKRQPLALLLVLCMCLALQACGITAPRRAEGFADLESLGALDMDRTMTLSIGPALLHFAARHMDDDPEIVALLRSLDGVDDIRVADTVN